MKILRSLLVAGAAAVLSAALVLGGPATQAFAQNKPLTKVNIGLGGFSFGLLPLMVADAAGYFKEEGIDATLINTGGGANTMAALLGGSVELGGVVMSDTILAASKGQVVKVVAPLLTQYASDAIISKAAAAKAGITPDMPLVERMKRLKGMILAVSSRGSGIDKMWRYLLELGGLDPDKDVTLTVIKLDQMYAALRAGQIDGFNATAPGNNLAVVEGLAEWVARPSQGEVPGIENFLYTVVAAKADYITAHPDIVAAAVRAMQKANALAQSDPNKVAELLREKYMSQTDLPLLQATVKDQQKAFPSKLELTEEGFQKNLVFMKRFGDTVDTVKYTDIVDPQFVKALK